MSSAAFPKATLSTPTFIDQYGVWPVCEKDFPEETLRARIKAVSDINNTLGIDALLEQRPYDYEKTLAVKLTQIRGYWLDFDASGIPSLRKIEEYFVKKEASGWEKFKTKYHLYRGEFQRQRDNKLQELIRLQDEIANELNFTPLNSEHPLQNLRDRCRRLQMISAERESLSYALQVSHASHEALMNQLSLAEKVVFWVISWFHSFRVPAYNKKFEIKSLENSAATLNEKGVKLGERKILFGKEEIQIEIKARFELSSNQKFNAKTEFYISRAGNEAILGYFRIFRMWSRTRPNGSYDPMYFEYMHNPGKAVGVLRNRALSIDYIEVRNEWKTSDGDRPILRLLTQLAVEILQHESDKQLEIGSNRSDAHVYFAGGFSDLHHNLQKVDKVKRAILQAREAHKLFPDPKDLSSFTVYLGKSPSNPFTQFVTVDEKDQEQPAKVDFALGKDPITWEKYIQTHRLLPEKGPILPRFFYQDLSCFENPSQGV
jgi:hypothetical protein